jgi:hypothetical protein
MSPSKTGDIVYHNQLGYIRLEKSITEDKLSWECEVLSNEKKIGNEFKHVIGLNDVKYYTDIEVKCHIED